MSQWICQNCPATQSTEFTRTVDDLTPSDLKTILHSKRANIYYLEHCRILVNGGRVEYVTDAGQRQLYWNIPIANTTVIMLGTGTSVTQAAMRELAKAGVMVGFCGGGGTPLISGVEREVAAEWFSPQSEYRPTQYLQQWVSFWFDDEKRLSAAKRIQITRTRYLLEEWTSRHLREAGFETDTTKLTSLLDEASVRIQQAGSVNTLLTDEARLTKDLYKLAAQTAGYGEFTRSNRGGGTDAANRLLDHGNYLAYGLGATATWVLGIPHALAVLHGKTRRGGLVFDTADLVKDAIILPQAFLSAMVGHEEQEFRDICIGTLADRNSLDYMIDTLKDISEEFGV